MLVKRDFTFESEPEFLVMDERLSVLLLDALYQLGLKPELGDFNFGYGKKPVIKACTPGWTYIIGLQRDGISISPANTSRRFAEIVEAVMAVSHRVLTTPPDFSNDVS